uniref:Uncharacterized protein n=1 Tax=Avena sativa TaxID=4498 RepID=A0ACD5T879_AVESA
MRCCPSSLTPAPALEDENILHEILLRLPPQPSSLPRASLVCKLWRSILSDTQFLKRFREHHREPPLLGFFTGHIGVEPVFTSVLDSPDRIPPARFSLPQSHRPSHHWLFMGCRHGLAVLINEYEHVVVVWDPLTGQKHRVPFPRGLCNNERGSGWRWHAAVMCAAAEDGHVHGDCFWSPFKLVLACGGYSQAFACLYESISGVWGNIVSTATTPVIHPLRPSVLIGNELYWLFSDGGILAFNIESQTFGVIERPETTHRTGCWSCQPLRTDDGLGLAVMSKQRIQFWERKSNYNGVVGWVLMQKSIRLEGMFPQKMPRDDKWVLLVGYDEDTNVIVLSTGMGKFMLQLDSLQIKKISGKNDSENRFMEFYPYTNFYTAGRAIAGGDDRAENVNKYLDLTVHQDTKMALCCRFFRFCTLLLLMWPTLKLMLYVGSRFFRLA